MGNSSSQVECGAGTTLMNDKCEVISKIECGEGTNLRYNKCEVDPKYWIKVQF